MMLTVLFEPANDFFHWPIARFTLIVSMCICVYDLRLDVFGTHYDQIQFKYAKLWKYFYCKIELHLYFTSIYSIDYWCHAQA